MGLAIIQKASQDEQQNQTTEINVTESNKYIQNPISIF